MGTSLVSIAVTWLGRSYYDPTNVQRASAPFVGGAYVDPCARPGSARLFLISQHLKGLSRALAPLTGATAVLLGGRYYENSDSGTTEMHTALSAGAVFASVNSCYVGGAPPGTVSMAAVG